jgi:7-keto-8-aminopelargonate synthetase-like enzyme
MPIGRGSAGLSGPSRATDYTPRMRTDPLAYLGEELDSLKKQNLYRPLRILDGEQKAHTTFDHRSVVNLSSNNYLGLTTHPRLRAKALEAVDAFGVGSGSVRTIAGTMAIHLELERRLAEFKRVEAVVVFQSGFTANAGTVSAILTKDDVVISDELNHASIIDGCRLSRATVKVFPHKDVDATDHQRIADSAAPAAHHRRRVQHGWGSWSASGIVRARRRDRLHHDGGRRACERRLWQEWARHH